MKNIKVDKHLVTCLLFIALSISVLYFTYPVIDEKDAVLLDAKELPGDIGTPGKRLLNGYFGTFLRFKHLGNINWLAIPLLIWFFTTAGKRDRRFLALVYVYLLLAVLIGFTGYYNARYQMTLFPFNLALILFLLWQYLKDKKKYLKILCFSFLILLYAYNIYHYFDLYKFFWEIKTHPEKTHFPHRVVDFLDRPEVNDKARIIVFNQPLYFYYTDKKGIECQSIDGLAAWLEIAHKQKGDRLRLDRALRRLKVGYILLRAAEKKIYHESVLREYFETQCTLELNDNGWSLYKLRPHALEKEFTKRRGYKKIRVWNPKRKRLKRLSPSLRNHGIRGEFDITVTGRGRRNRAVTVRNIKPGPKGLRLIRLGFNNKRPRELRLENINGRYLHLVVKARISKSAMNKRNYVFIQDYDGDWQKETHYFTTPYWRTYIVSKKIRSKSTKLTLGFAFEPGSTEESLLFKDVRIYISDHPAWNDGNKQ